MKKVVSLVLLLSMLCAIALTLVSCGEPKDDGARISVYLGSEICDFDPTDYYVDSNAEQVMSLLFEPLFRYQNGKLKCAMAESYEVDEEERTIVITLRESYWSNNVRVKAADFVYAWSEKLLSPSNPNPAAALLYDIENAAEHKNGTSGAGDPMIEATGVYELTVTYREGADYEQLLRNLASVATSPILEPDAITATYWSKSSITAYTNGPFKLASYEPDEGTGFTLERNKGYHQSYAVKDYDNEVNPGEIVVFTTPYGEAITASYKQLEEKVVFFLADAPLAERSEYIKKADLNDDTSVYTYVFNTANPLFAITEVRQALSLAIDREAIAKAVTYGKAADGFLPEVSGGASDALIKTTADMAAAKALIATVENKLPTKSFTLTIADNEESIAIAELVKAAWGELGFNVTVKKVGKVETEINIKTDTDTQTETIYDSGIQALVKKQAEDVNNNAFDVIAIDWQTYTNDGYVALASLTTKLNGCGRVLPNGGVRTSITRWSDATYDGLVDAISAAETAKERKAKVADAEKYVCDQLPVLPILFNQTATFDAKELSKVKYDSFGNFIFTDAALRGYKKYLEEE